jgi:LysR family nitrogen assimilation transcriptional regulator
MDLRSIEYFVRIAELGSLTRAASRLNIAQPALSRHVQRLEDELGVPLFTRAKRGVRLTEAGRLLYENSTRILRDIERTRDEVKTLAAAPSGKVVLGILPTLGPVLVPDLIARTRNDLPRLTLKVMEGFSVSLQEWLLAGHLDLAVINDPLPSRVLSCVPLASEEMVLVTAPGARDRDRPLSAAELAETSLIMTDGLRVICERLLAPHGIALRVETEMNAIETIRLMARKGLGATIMPYAVVKPECDAGVIAAHRLVVGGLRRNLVIATPAMRHLSSGSQAVIELLREQIVAVEQAGGLALDPR